MSKAKVKKIDIHVHTAPKSLLDLEVPGRAPYANPQQLKSMCEAVGIDKAIILPPLNVEGSGIKSTNELTYLITEEYKDFYYWFLNIDPRFSNNTPTADFSPKLQHYKSLGAKGVGELCCNLSFNDARTENLFSHCEALDLPVLFHIAPKDGNNYGLVDDLGLPRLEKALKKFPKLKFIGHSQPFWSEISGDLTEEKRNTYPTGKVVEGRLTKLLRDYPNLYCDLSAGSGLNAMSRDIDHAAKFLTEFQDRVMFGTDICSPLNTHHIALSEFYDNLYFDDLISESIYKKICRENAIRLLNL